MRFAINTDVNFKHTCSCDVVVVGSGIAGLYTALHIDPRLSCLVITKKEKENSASWLAQGGIAAAIGDQGDITSHLNDTITAGAGLCDKKAVQTLVCEAASNIQNLISLKVPFDLNEDGSIRLTREGGHSKPRILHAGGDAIGKKTVSALLDEIERRKNITLKEHTCLYDIFTDNNNICGIAARAGDKEFHYYKTNYVVLATGGAGRMFKSSTNPPTITGDGIASALRAGAKTKNLELIQFHPTTLKSEKIEETSFLITEAIRGEGGVLINTEGERFMLGVHPMAELAPRDIVARGIVSELKRSGNSQVYIDITAKSEDFLKNRFPTVYQKCLNRGINIAKDKIPVGPAAHYLMGGIETDQSARTNINGLYACGETAHTGIHGANRLASNSLLECLVFAKRCADNINETFSQSPQAQAAEVDMLTKTIPARCRNELDIKAKYNEISTLMSEYCGVIKTRDGLNTALERIDKISQELQSTYNDSTEYLETLNIAAVAGEVLKAALKRKENIGAHYVEM